MYGTKGAESVNESRFALFMKVYSPKGDVTPPTLHSMASEAEKDTQDSENEADSDLESYSDEDTDSDDSSCNEN
ncbi:hypothetical protein OUZ56_019141 [Daphnia magna]|uniref:Uncharacterized protein n=1 Tax=Daphnia magna TaxID=35525 RepID=A0ABQ9ZAR7_9CRUS|nr:hypothetical protein OUZ56_019141 [Daphnia magna]